MRLVSRFVAFSRCRWTGLWERPRWWALVWSCILVNDIAEEVAICSLCFWCLSA